MMISMFDTALTFRAVCVMNKMRACKEVKVNADQLRGRLAEVNGYIEEWVGRLMGNQWLIARGRMNLAIGLARAKFGDIKEEVRKRNLIGGRRHGGRAT